LGARVRIIASAAHRLVVERSYTNKSTNIRFAANCLFFLLEISLQFTQFAIKPFQLNGTHLYLDKYFYLIIFIISVI